MALSAQSAREAHLPVRDQVGHVEGAARDPDAIVIVGREENTEQGLVWEDIFDLGES